MRALFDSIVRTLTPIIVGAVVGWITTAGIALDPEFQGALTVVVGAAFSGIYYVAVRLLETYVTPKFGWLLGLAKAPEYDGGNGRITYVQLNASDIERLGSGSGVEITYNKD